MSRLSVLSRIFTTPYDPHPTLCTYLDRSQTQTTPTASVTVAVLDAAESEQVLGVPLARHGMQAVFLRVTNRGTSPLRLQILSIDPNYFTPLEAAGVCHYSLLKRLSAFGLLAWFVLPIVFLLLPLKLVTAYRANRRIDDCFRSLAFHLRPIQSEATSEGFVFTRLDSGTKVVHVCLNDLGRTTSHALENQVPHGTLEAAAHPAVEMTFSIPIPGIAVDYHRRNFQALIPAGSVEACKDAHDLIHHLASMPAVTTNKRNSGTGDPVNLVVIGEFETLIAAFAARWDETESITLSTCWKTSRSFLLGSEYRYSPVSPLYLFGRSQDVALQRSRRSINERLHLRLWLTHVTFLDRPVWVGQVSRDIGVRFTTRTWNLTTHRIDPDVDEARDYVVEDLLEAERLDAAGYVDGVGECSSQNPRHNLTGDPYFTDGKRAVVFVSAIRTAPRFMAWS